MFKILTIEDGARSASSWVQEWEARLASCSNPSIHLHHARSLDEGMERLAAAPFDGVLLALDSVAGRSLGALRRLHARFGDLPIIVLARKPAEDGAELALRAGAQDYLLADDSEPKLVWRALRYGIERKKMEVALRSAETNFSKAVRASLDYITITTLAEGRFLEANDGFLRSTGYSREEVIGKTSLEIATWVDPADRARMLTRLRSHGRVHECEVQFRMKHGEVRECLFSAELIDLGGTDCVLAIARDVTESKRLQKQSEDARRTETLGRLASGLAHDFNNWLTVMLGHCDLVLAKISPSDPVAGNIGHIKSAIASAESLVAQLLSIGREKNHKPQVIDLNLTVARVGKILRRVFHNNLDFIVRLDALPRLVKVYPVQLEQALLNLALNARDAMPGGGTLVIESGGLELGDESAATCPGVAPGSYSMLTVTDTGVGMDAHTAAHIFDPFFSTKEPGKGTGLGLYTVHDFVRQSGGFIIVQSEPNRGTTFRIGFPDWSARKRAKLKAPEPTLFEV
jgi:PAS domain S-box-containing protein